MPLYEYQCSACAHRFERIVKFSDAPLTVCPQCGQESIEQLISAPAVQFKGSGWYVTDYARKGSTTPPAAASSAKGDGANGSAAKESSTPSATPAPNPAPSSAASSTTDSK